MSRSVTLLRGLGALVLLVALVVGLPAALWAVGGSPIPSSIPDWEQVWSALTSRDDGTLFLGLLRVVAWAGWALFAASVAADLVARARRVQVPRLGPQQALASHLVAAVAALAVLAPTAATAAPAQAPAASSSATTAAAPAAAWAAESARLAAGERTAHVPATDESAVEAAWRAYVVVGGDTLWDIADRELGDPWRWTEVFAASTRIVQPDGRRLSDPDLILPGWTLRVPASASQPVPAVEQLDAGEPGLDEPPESEAPDDAVLTPLDTARSTATAAQASAHVAPVEAISTPLSTRAGAPTEQVSTPLSTTAAAGDEVLADDWRAMIRRAVPELR